MRRVMGGEKMTDTTSEENFKTIPNPPDPGNGGEPVKEKDMIMSYLTLRKTIGILGVLLPFILALGGMLLFREGLQPSISAYYHLDVGDVLVGTLFVLGFFLFAYRGYDKTDDFVSNLACIFALGIALFPVAPLINATPRDLCVSKIHYGFTFLFFAALIYMSLFLFTKTKKPTTKEKKKRNIIYRSCGYIMLISVVLIVVYAIILPESAKTSLKAHHPVFWFETVALLSFGVSWLTKGGAILKDKPPQ